MIGPLGVMRLDGVRIINFTIPPSPDWTDPGGRYRAQVQIEKGCIVAAILYEWKVIRYVCFGKGDHQRDWRPVMRWQVAPKTTRQRAGYLPDWP